jgi:hypothetical protein
VAQAYVAIGDKQAGIGTEVVIKSSGLTGTIWQIGRFGLVGLYIPGNPIAASRPYDPTELAIVGEEGSEVRQ